MSAVFHYTGAWGISGHCLKVLDLPRLSDSKIETHPQTGIFDPAVGNYQKI
jgi:hypothetical protein